MREPAGGSAAAGVRGVAPLSDGTSQFRGGTRGRYSQAWGWRMWYLGEVVCPVMAGAGQRNVMDGKGVAVQGRVRGSGGRGSGGLRCIGVLLPAAPLECGLGHAGGRECRGAEDGKKGAARKDGG